MYIFTSLLPNREKMEHIIGVNFSVKLTTSRGGPVESTQIRQG